MSDTPIALSKKVEFPELDLTVRGAISIARRHNATLPILTSRHDVYVRIWQRIRLAVRTSNQPVIRLIGEAIVAAIVVLRIR